MLAQVLRSIEVHHPLHRNGVVTGESALWIQEQLKPQSFWELETNAAELWDVLYSQELLAAKWSILTSRRYSSTESLSQ
jgi:hypothetical protein